MCFPKAWRVGLAVVLLGLGPLSVNSFAVFDAQRQGTQRSPGDGSSSITLGMTLGKREAFTIHGRMIVSRHSRNVFRSRSTITRCYVSRKDNDDNKSPRGATAATSQRIVYQKVVRPPPNLPDIIFLGSLVEFLQEHFEIPQQLAMPYEATVCDNDEADRDKVLVEWDSPLSPCPSATRLQVEVVGIYTDDDDDDDTAKSLQHDIPHMAMVVVRKDAPVQGQSTKDALPPMMKGLFDDSEQKILRSLDRQLQDFVTGKTAIGDGSSQRNSSSPRKDQTLEDQLLQAHDDLLSELDTDSDAVLEPPLDTKAFKSHSKPNNKSPSTSGSIDVDFSRVGSGTAESSTPSASRDASGLGFAVEAAKRAQKKRAQKQAIEKSVPLSQADFAVQAAATAMKQTKTSKPKGNTEQTFDAPSPEGERATQKSSDTLNLSSLRPPILDQQDSRAFQSTVSTPQDFANRTRLRRSKNQVPSKLSQTAKESRSSKETKEMDIPPTVVDEASATSNTPENDTSEDDDSLNRQIIQAAQEALDEVASSGEDMTAEELLDQVMTYGEETKKEERVGSGFVSGAFEKAKELLREQQASREKKLEDAVVDRVVHEVGGMGNDNNGQIETETLSPDEEIRRMFEAGERIADGRIAVASPHEVVKSGSRDYSKDMEEVDSLIAGEKSVSGHARALDEELAELEVRINRSPGEGLDGPQKNPLFDIFSGPEVYNPNVDPETAVNWPGALPGTHQVRMPTELNEALRQAEFAAGLLSVVREEEMAIDGEGVVKKFFAGDRELTEAQVNNMRTVVKEAVQIGLIPDPLTMTAERARLSMVIDELREQPEERMREITSNYKDLMLSDNFVPLVKERLNAMADRDINALKNRDDSLEKDHAREREILGQLVAYAGLLLKEARALGAELEAQQLEVIRSICKVAMDPSLTTEEETSIALSDAVRDMRPLLDDAFVAYLKYAVAEEEGRLARAGLLDDPEHNKWLFVLKIVQQGVYTELSRGIQRYIDHIFYVVRMETPIERRALLKKLIDVMPTLDVRPFVQVVESIVGSLGDAASGNFDGVFPLGEMTNKLLQLRRDVHDLLPPDRIALMSRDADEWAARQKKRLLDQRKATRQRLKASYETEALDGEIEALGRREEIDRID